jgi:hypothetical protein
MKLANCLVLLLVTLLLLGCEEDMETEIKNEQVINTELGALPKLMSLPKIPEKVKWEIDENGENGDRDSGGLSALLYYTQENYDYIVNNSPSFESPGNVNLQADFYKKWVPRSLQESIKTIAKNDSFELVGVIPLQSGLFTKTELSPYVNGSVIPLGDGYVLVSLYSM